MPDAGPLLHEFQIFGGNPDKALAIIAKLDASLEQHGRPGPACRCMTAVFGTFCLKTLAKRPTTWPPCPRASTRTPRTGTPTILLLGATIDFSVLQAWTKLKDGYDALPKEMVRRFEELGGEVRTGTRLLRAGARGPGRQRRPWDAARSAKAPYRRNWPGT